jgi:actin-related protein 3
MFKNFGRKLRMEVQRVVDARLGPNSKGVPVTVTRHRGRDISVWTGGSLLSVAPDFLSTCHTKDQYEESGPSICWNDQAMPY